MGGLPCRDACCSSSRWHFLLVSKAGHSSSYNAVLPLVNLLTNLAARFWIFSTSLMSFFKWGSHTADANSTCGLTKAAYDLSLVCSGHFDRFLLRNANERVALPAICLMWCSHFRPD